MMFEGLPDKKIRFRLALLTEQEPQLLVIEKHQKIFAECIRHLLSLLDQSPTGRALVKYAAIHQVSAGLDPLLEPSGSYFYPQLNHFDLGYQPEILQTTEKGISRYLVSFIASLRRAWHFHQGYSAAVSLKPEDFLRQYRCEEADIEAVTHLIAWELRAAGKSFFWRSLVADMNGDVAVIFEREIEKDPYAQFDGRALKSAFNQWFAVCERVNMADHLALDYIDMALLQPENHGLVGSRSLQREKLQQIGSLPNGRNYLEGCFFTSSWYDGLDDDFNRAHLRHIEADIAQLTEGAY